MISTHSEWVWDCKPIYTLSLSGPKRAVAAEVQVSLSHGPHAHGDDHGDVPRHDRLLRPLVEQKNRGWEQLEQ